MRTSPYRLNISETCILDNTPFLPLSVGVYWLHLRLNCLGELLSRTHSIPHLNSAVFHCCFLLKWEFQWFRLRSVSLDLTETAETVGSAGHTASWRPISLVHGTAGVCVPNWCASSFPALLRHLPLDLSVPFRDVQWSLSWRIMGCLLFFQRLPYADRPIPDH